MKEGERYELKIAIKQTEIPRLKVLPYKANIDHELLNTVVFMGNFESIQPDDEIKKLTSDHIETFVKSIVEQDGALHDLVIIITALRELLMPMVINESEAQVVQYSSKFLTVSMELVTGYSEPKIRNKLANALCKMCFRILLRTKFRKS